MHDKFKATQATDKSTLREQGKQATLTTSVTLRERQAQGKQATVLQKILGFRF